jgi:glycogen(starch) synthase
MRILHVASEYPPLQIFGLGRYVCDLSRALAAAGHNVDVLTNSMGGANQDVEDHGVRVHRVDFPPPPKPPTPAAPVMAFNLHLQQRAHALGREALGDPEVLVSHDWLTALAGERIARRLDIPHVWTVHDTVIGKRFGKVTEMEDVVARGLETWATRRADLLLVNSRAIGEEVVGAYGGERDRIRLLHPGVDLARFGWPISERRREAFRCHFARPDEILITYCGRLDLEKGIDTLINAFSLVTADVPHARLAIVGRGALEPMIREHIGKLGLDERVRLFGYLEGRVLEQYYRASDIHVCPSNYEPFGLVAAEAMAAGAAVVVSATGGLVDIVSSPDVGRTFPARDVGTLAAILKELCLDPSRRKSIADAGRRHVAAHFAWPVLAELAVKLYAEAAAVPV